MHRTLASLLAVAALCLCAPAHAQEVKTRPSIADTQVRAPVVPKDFQKILAGYKDWKPTYETEPFANSVYNWSNRARETVDDTDGVSNAAAWLFSLSESRFNALVSASTGLLRTVFGPIYKERNVRAVLMVPYTGDIDAKYAAWYACMAKVPGYNGEPVGEQYVLAEINWREDRTAGPKNECQEPLVELAKPYKVSELTVDELMVVGFLHRRFAANQKDQKLLSAEAIRKAMHEVFNSGEY